MTGASIIERSKGSHEEAIDDDDLLELGSTSHKESVAEVTFGGQLNEDQRDQVERLVGRFASLFLDKPGSTNITEHEIKLTSDKPICPKPYTIPFSVQESLKSDINMLDMGIIRESKSSYASPVAIIQKKDGTN